MSIVTATISSEGQNVGNQFAAVHIDVWREANRIPGAQITFADGDIANRRFAASQSPLLAPGKEMEIKLRYEGEPASEKTVFKGLVISQTVEASEGTMQLTVELRDKTFKMTTARRSTVFREVKDSDIFKKLIQQHGLRAGTVTATTVTHPEIVQYDCSDWDFLLLRAEANGMLVKVQDGEVSIVRPAVGGGAAHRYEFGMSPIFAFEMRADASEQWGGAAATAWDLSAQDMLSPENGSAPAPGLGNLRPGALADVFGAASQRLFSPGTRGGPEMKAWADGRLARSRMALHRGWLAVEGEGSLALFDTLEVAGISDKFNGRALVTGLRHQVGPEGWRSEIQFGLSPEPHARAFQDVAGLPAGGLLPAVRGLQIGVVEAFAEDPEGHFRVKVRIPTLGADDSTVWARQLRPDAGNERGLFFFPETGDEVVLGFLNDDPREPLILGSLHSSANALPAPIGSLTENNYLKGIFTREGMHLLFDDEKKTLTILTANDQKITLNGQDKKLEITDGNNNKITLDDKGILLESDGDIKIDAKGNVEIKGVNVDVK